MAGDDQNNEPSRLWEVFDSIRPADLSWAEWTRRAHVSVSFFTDIRRKGTKPSYDKLGRVLGVVGMSLSDFHALESERDGAPLMALHSPRTPFTSIGDPRDVPMLGTAQAADFQVTADGTMVFAEQIDVHLDEVIDMVRRPPALKDRKTVYSLTVRGTSLKPKFEDGDPIYVDPEQRPSIGDIVVVQLMTRDEEGEGRIASVLIKELVRRGSDYIELEQYNPPLRFRIAARQVASIHRWVPWRELVSF
jgi:phage repressor protein C with HTH and peptisase S24 domain